MHLNDFADIVLSLSAILFGLLLLILLLRHIIMETARFDCEEREFAALESCETIEP